MYSHELPITYTEKLIKIFNDNSMPPIYIKSIHDEKEAEKIYFLYKENINIYDISNNLLIFKGLYYQFMRKKYKKMKEIYKYYINCNVNYVYYYYILYYLTKGKTDKAIKIGTLAIKKTEEELNHAKCYIL